MAPEVIEMQPYTVGGDIWSLGCTIIELLSGTPPYYELNQIQAMYAIVNDRHPPLGKLTLSPELADFLELCFQANPADRPSAATLLQHRFITMHNSEDLPDYYKDTSVKPLQAKKMLERTDTVQSVQKLLKVTTGDFSLAREVESKLADLVEMKKKESGFSQALVVARARLAKAEEQYQKLQEQILSSRDELRSLCVKLSVNSGIDLDTIWEEKERELAAVPATTEQKTEEFVLSIISPATTTASAVGLASSHPSAPLAAPPGLSSSCSTPPGLSGSASGAPVRMYSPMEAQVRARKHQSNRLDDPSPLSLPIPKPKHRRRHHHRKSRVIAARAASLKATITPTSSLIV
jgi:serine/threonine protein kinase